MKSLLLFFLASLFSISVFAQNGTPLPAGARGMAMGNTGIANQTINSIFSNSAGLAYLKGTHLVAFGEQRFAGLGINNIAVGAGHSVGSGTFGLSLQSFGAEAYSEQKIGLSYARKLFNQLSMGVQFDYINTSIDKYGSTGAFTFEIGFVASLNKDITVGVHAFSPIRVAITDEEDLPSSIGFGFSYHPSKKVTFNAEVEKAIDTDLSINAGLEYWIHKVVSIRVGGSVQPTLATFGLGFKVNDNFYIDVASTWHQVLGVSPGLGVRYGL